MKTFVEFAPPKDQDGQNVTLTLLLATQLSSQKEKVVNIPSLNSVRKAVNGLGLGLLFAITLEAALMASGQLLTVGPLTVKMLLYLLSLVFVLIELMLGVGLSAETYYIVLSFTFLAAFGSLIGVLNGASEELLTSDLRVYAYVPALCFFDLAIRSQRAVDLVSKVIRISAVIMLAACALIVTLVLFGQVSVSDMVHLLAIGRSDDFMLDSEGLGVRVFYKGYIYLGIGLLFWANRPGWRTKMFALLAFILIVLSGTRGLTVSVIASLALLIALTGKRRVLAKLLALCLFLLMVLLAPLFVSSLRGEEQISISNETRLSTINQVENGVTIGTLLWGHGLGNGVPERPEHMEITYLEIFHKNGLIGLAVWGSLLVLTLRRYVHLKRSTDRFETATPFVLGVLLVVIDAFTNPTLNNPIGLSMVFICFSVLGFLGTRQRGERINQGKGGQVPERC